jgi:hypothetical protein
MPRHGKPHRPSRSSLGESNHLNRFSSQPPCHALTHPIALADGFAIKLLAAANSSWSPPSVGRNIRSLRSPPHQRLTKRARPKGETFVSRQLFRVEHSPAMSPRRLSPRQYPCPRRVPSPPSSRHRRNPARGKQPHLAARCGLAGTRQPFRAFAKGVRLRRPNRMAMGRHRD